MDFRSVKYFTEREGFLLSMPCQFSETEEENDETHDKRQCLVCTYVSSPYVSDQVQTQITHHLFGNYSKYLGIILQKIQKSSRYALVSHGDRARVRRHENKYLEIKRESWKKKLQAVTLKDLEETRLNFESFMNSKTLQETALTITSNNLTARTPVQRRTLYTRVRQESKEVLHPSLSPWVPCQAVSSQASITPSTSTGRKRKREEDDTELPAWKLQIFETFDTVVDVQQFLTKCSQHSKFYRLPQYPQIDSLQHCHTHTHPFTQHCDLMTLKYHMDVAEVEDFNARKEAYSALREHLDIHERRRYMKVEMKAIRNMWNFSLGSETIVDAGVRKALTFDARIAHHKARSIHEVAGTCTSRKRQIAATIKALEEHAEADVEYEWAMKKDPTLCDNKVRRLRTARNIALGDAKPLSAVPIRLFIGIRHSQGEIQKPYPEVERGDLRNLRSDEAATIDRILQNERTEAFLASWYSQ